MKCVNILMPELGPFGETFLEARVRAIVEALLVNSPGGGCVESVFTLATHLFVVFLVALRFMTIASMANAMRSSE